MNERRIDPRLARLATFLRYVLTRFRDDGCLAAAGALSYTTLVSLVPLMVISLAVLSAFPIFDTLKSQLLGFVFNAFVPSIGGTVEQYITTFAASAGRTTAVGIAVLAVTAITLLTTIEDRLDAIWRVTVSRRWATRVTVYWTVMTLGPVLFGVAFSLSGDLGAVSHVLPIADTPGSTAESVLHAVSFVVPVTLDALGLTLFYCLIPNCLVRWRDGLVGGVVAAILFEICKFGFAIFIGHYSSYEAVYGALAVIPTFLLWMYLSWSVVLVGAEIAAAVPLWGVDEALERPAELPDLELALHLIDALAAQSRRGGPARLRDLARAAHVPAGIIGRCLDLLIRAGLLAATADGGFVLARDLDTVLLLDLQRMLDDRPVARPRGGAGLLLDERLAAVRQAEIGALSVSVASILDLTGQAVGSGRTE